MPKNNRTHLLLATLAPILVVVASIVITLSRRPAASTKPPAGEWTYTVEALKVPYENFPYDLCIGKGDSRPAPVPAR